MNKRHTAILVPGEKSFRELFVALIPKFLMTTNASEL